MAQPAFGQKRVDVYSRDYDKSIQFKLQIDWTADSNLMIQTYFSCANLHGRKDTMMLLISQSSAGK